jgi:hypothetical protein
MKFNSIAQSSLAVLSLMLTTVNSFANPGARACAFLHRGERRLRQ